LGASTTAHCYIRSKDYRKVPIAIYNTTVWKGSDVILQELLADLDVQTLLQDEKKVNLDQFDGESAQFWTNHAVDKVAVMLYPNMCRTLGESRQAFGYVDQHFTPFQRFAVRHVGSVAMYMAGRRVLSMYEMIGLCRNLIRLYIEKHNITDASAALQESLDAVQEDLKQGKTFLSGQDQPHLGDLNVFGVLRSLQGLPIHDEIMTANPRLEEWYNQVDETVER